MSEDWVARARAELLRRRGGQGAWGYRIGARPSVEPTALAILALQGGSECPAVPAQESVVHQAAGWLASTQRPDGALEASPGVQPAAWPTAYALLAWNRVGSHHGASARAAAWLIAEQGRPMRQDSHGQAPVFGHDPALIGWPWIDGTHSWVEPTALAILALCVSGHGAHPRVVQGARLLEDRALPHGGWNYGNRSVFGRELRPQPGPSGLALLALAAVPAAGRPPSVDPAVGYLRATLPQLQAPISLGWGVLGLRAWEACPEEAGEWLARSTSLQASRRDAATGLGLLLLAGRRGRPFQERRDLEGARSS